MGSTLGFEETHTVLTGSYEVKLKDNEATFSALSLLEKRLDELNEKNGWDLTLFVPGDTVNVDDMYGSVFIGRSLLWVYAEDPPTVFNPRSFAGRFLKLETMTDEDRKFLMDVDGLEIESIGQAAVHLISGGPLCYGAIHIGVSMNEEDRDNAKYKYSSNQDMSQEWGPEGIDAVYLTSVEFTDHHTFDYMPETIDAHEAKVPLFTEPKFFLLCRYD